MKIKIFCRCSLFPSWSGYGLISTPVLLAAIELSFGSRGRYSGTDKANKNVRKRNNTKITAQGDFTIFVSPARNVGKESVSIRSLTTNF
jgi:hypothetical protein